MSVLDDFENLTLDDALDTFEKYSYVDLASIAATNDSMKAFIKKEVTTNGFLTRWTARQSVDEQKTDCHVGIAKLILTTFGGGAEAETEKEEDERVETWRKFLDAAYMQTRTFATAGRMMKAFLEAHTEITNRLVGKVFECVWTLGNRYLDVTILPELIPHFKIVNTYERHLYWNRLEKETEERAKEGREHVYRFHQHVEQAFLFDTSPQPRRLLVLEIFKRFVAFTTSAEHIAHLLVILIADPIPGKDLINRRINLSESLRYRWQCSTVAKTAAFFKHLMEDVEATSSEGTFDVLAEVFRQTLLVTVIESIRSAPFVAEEPCLLYLFFHGHGALTERTAFFVTALLMSMDYQWRLDEKLDDAHNAIRKIRAHYAATRKQELAKFAELLRGMSHITTEYPFFDMGRKYKNTFFDTCLNLFEEV